MSPLLLPPAHGVAARVFRSLRGFPLRVALACATVLVLAFASAGVSAAASLERGVIDHVTDGDTVVLTKGKRIRLVQIDTPEIYFGTECWGKQASARAKVLLPPRTRVRLLGEPETDNIDDYGRELRYVIRLRD